MLSSLKPEDGFIVAQSIESKMTTLREAADRLAPGPHKSIFSSFIEFKLTRDKQNLILEKDLCANLDRILSGFELLLYKDFSADLEKIQHWNRERGYLPGIPASLMTFPIEEKICSSGDISVLTSAYHYLKQSHEHYTLYVNFNLEHAYANLLNFPCHPHYYQTYSSQKTPSFFDYKNLLQAEIDNYPHWILLLVARLNAHPLIHPEIKSLLEGILNDILQNLKKMPSDEDAANAMEWLIKFHLKFEYLVQTHLLGPAKIGILFPMAKRISELLAEHKQIKSEIAAAKLQPENELHQAQLAYKEIAIIRDIYLNRNYSSLPYQFNFYSGLTYYQHNSDRGKKLDEEMCYKKVRIDQIERTAQFKLELKRIEEEEVLKKREAEEALKKIAEAEALKKKEETEALNKIKAAEALKKFQEAEALKKVENENLTYLNNLFSNMLRDEIPYISLYLTYEREKNTHKTAYLKLKNQPESDDGDEQTNNVKTELFADNKKLITLKLKLLEDTFKSDHAEFICKKIATYKHRNALDEKQCLALTSDYKKNIITPAQKTLRQQTIDELKSKIAKNEKRLLIIQRILEEKIKQEKLKLVAAAQEDESENVSKSKKKKKKKEPKKSPAKKTVVPETKSIAVTAPADFEEDYLSDDEEEYLEDFDAEADEIKQEAIKTTNDPVNPDADFSPENLPESKAPISESIHKKKNHLQKNLETIQTWATILLQNYKKIVETNPAKMSKKIDKNNARYLELYFYVARFFVAFNRYTSVYTKTQHPCLKNFSKDIIKDIRDALAHHALFGEPATIINSAIVVTQLMPNYFHNMVNPITGTASFSTLELQDIPPLEEKASASSTQVFEKLALYTTYKEQLHTGRARGLTPTQIAENTSLYLSLILKSLEKLKNKKELSMFFCRVGEPLRKGGLDKLLEKNLGNAKTASKFYGYYQFLEACKSHRNRLFHKTYADTDEDQYHYDIENLIGLSRSVNREWLNSLLSSSSSSRK